jgi:hypothetical protein
VAAPAVGPGTPVAGIGRQHLAEQAAAELQQPGPQDRPGRLQAGIAAAQDPGRLGSQPPYLGCLLRRDRVAGPLFSPSAREGPPVPDAGLASQIASLTSTIRSASNANSW